MKTLKAILLLILIGSAKETLSNIKKILEVKISYNPTTCQYERS